MKVADVIAKDSAMRQYAEAHDCHATMAQTGDAVANGAALYVLRAYTAELRDPEPEKPCDCVACMRYVLRLP